jgi:hypothetical protein
VPPTVRTPPGFVGAALRFGALPLQLAGLLDRAAQLVYLVVVTLTEPHVASTSVSIALAIAHAARQDHVRKYGLSISALPTSTVGHGSGPSSTWCASASALQPQSHRTNRPI